MKPFFLSPKGACLPPLGTAVPILGTLHGTGAVSLLFYCTALQILNGSGGALYGTHARVDVWGFDGCASVVVASSTLSLVL